MSTESLSDRLFKRGVVKSFAKTVLNEALVASPRTFIESVLLFAHVPCTRRLYVLRNGIRLHHDPETLDRMVIRECLINKFYTRYVGHEKLKAVVDLGAHKGYFVVGLLEKISAVETLVCVEPLSENIEAIRSNLELNPNLSSKIGSLQIEQAAVTAAAGEVDFYITSNSVNHSIYDPKTFSSVVGKRTVKTIPLSSILAKYKLNEIDVLKIDIEGAEVELFDSKEEFAAILKSRQIIMETHPATDPRSSTALIDKLSQAGYRIHYP